MLRDPSRVTGMSMIAGGFVWVLVANTDLDGTLVIPVLGVGFLAGAVTTRRHGLLVPGGILTGLGVGLLIASQGGPGEAVVLGLGLGFVAITALTALVGEGDAPWWPLIPGGILTLVGGAQVAGIRDIGAYLVPAGLVLVGLALLLRRPRQQPAMVGMDRPGESTEQASPGPGLAAGRTIGRVGQQHRRSAAVPVTGDEPHPGGARTRYGRDTLEFGRVASLSDGLFAISMTLLVFTLDASAVSIDRVEGVLIDQTGELIAFALSFAVVANFWWVHHRFVANLGRLEPGLIVLNLALLGAVALIPFPTSLLGRDPTMRGAVVPYLALLSIVAILHLLLLARANTVAAWRRPMPRALFPWLLAGWGASAFVTLAGLGVAFVLPIAGLAMLLLTWPVEAAVAWRAPTSYRNWN